jgi:hypothetical protein
MREWMIDQVNAFEFSAPIDSVLILPQRTTDNKQVGRETEKN